MTPEKTKTKSIREEQYEENEEDEDNADEEDKYDNEDDAQCTE